MALKLKQAARTPVQIRLGFLVAIGVVALLIIAGLWYLVNHLSMPSLHLSGWDMAPSAVKLPTVLSEKKWEYKDALPKEKPPIATPVVATIPAPPPVATPIPAAAPPAPPPPPPSLPVQPQPDWYQLWRESEERAKAVQRATVEREKVEVKSKSVKEEEKPKDHQSWFIKPTNINLSDHTKKPEPSKEEVEKSPASKASALIHNAIWAKPAKPWLTLYRAHRLPCRTLDDINSDDPGQISLEITQPVFGGVSRNGEEIIPKGSIAIVKQVEKRLEFGQSRIAINLEEIDLPTDAVIGMKATIGDDMGANGLTGKINNHYGKLVAATAISAVLNIGVRSAAGTPGSGMYYQNPVQGAAQNVGEQVATDANKIVQSQLKVPPTVTLSAGALCSIALGENVTFSRKPVIVR